MNIIDAPQGSQQWLDIRAKHFTASEAPAMMGASKYTTRSELLRQKATGITEDVDDNKQRLFDRGHAAEAAARPIVEALIGVELYPATGTLEVDGLPLLASFDGLTMMEDTAWENKLFNAGLADQMHFGQLEPHYYWQLEQQLLVSGAERAFFTTSDGTPENTVGMWYASYPERRAALIAGWTQFAEDLANYQHTESKPEPTAATIEALPALLVQVEGRVIATNLDAFKASAQTFIDNIKTELVNDQDFADADKMVKFLKDGEERLAQAKQHALAQTASIDELFRTVDAISEQMRSKRLALDKLVKAEKVNRKAAIISGAQSAYETHIKALNARLGGQYMPCTNPGFAEAAAGLKSLDSMRDKVAGALANAKIEANEIADRIETHRQLLKGDNIHRHAPELHDAMMRSEPQDWIFLFPDFAQVCTKLTDDFVALLAVRLSQHEQRLRMEAEREKIRQEDAAEAKPPALDHSKPAGDVIPPVSAAAAVAARHDANDAATINETAIDDFIRLLSISAVEKKALRVNLLKWETYRIKMMVARGLAVAA